MLQMRHTRLTKSLFETLASGVVLQDEGCPLTFVKENGETRVELAVDGGKFAGIAIARHVPPTFLPMVEGGLIGEGGAGELARTPVAGQLLVKIDGVVANIVAADPVAGEVRMSGSAYQFSPDDEGKMASFQYHYAPTVAEARTVVGDTPYGGLSANALGTVAVIKQGEVATSYFDASADWSSALHAKLVGGKFAPATASQGLPGVTVKNSPSAGSPFLVLELNVG